VDSQLAEGQLASPSIMTWNQLRAFLEQMQNLQKAGFAAA
jgi:hypothetical protein